MERQPLFEYPLTTRVVQHFQRWWWDSLELSKPLYKNILSLCWQWSSFLGFSCSWVQSIQKPCESVNDTSECHKLLSAPLEDTRGPWCWPRKSGTDFITVTDNENITTLEMHAQYSKMSHFFLRGRPRWSLWAASTWQLHLNQYQSLYSVGPFFALLMPNFKWWSSV